MALGCDVPDAEQSGTQETQDGLEREPEPWDEPMDDPEPMITIGDCLLWARVNGLVDEGD